ncbi:MAG: rhomboid family intramembrane serine protease [Thermoanaerobaculia bacterium]|nr:rhomboid family intramembrane serine protease [Thermoanaerobaculia bacterium]
MTITYLIIGVTVLISIAAFNNPDILYKGRHWPYAEARRGEYYRWLSSGFLHGDYMHLLFNMITLYFFGGSVEQWFGVLFPEVGNVLFLLFYLISIVAASLATYYKFKDVQHFASIGASGAVSAVLFAAILLQPTLSLYLMFIPIPIPGFIYGAFYLWYSSYAAQRGGDGIDHTAHFYGAVFGFLFPLVLKPVLFASFLAQLGEWISSW